MIKRFLSIVLAGVTVLSLTACGKTKENLDVDFDVTEMMTYITGKADLPYMMEGGSDELLYFYELDAGTLTQYSVQLPMMMTSATELAVFKVSSEDEKALVKAGIEHRLATLTELWSTYLPDQFELVENNKIIEKGNYLFFIIADKESSDFAENVFLRKFDPSIEELVLVRKFRELNNATLKSVSDTGAVVEYTENGVTYTFDCTFSEFFYAEDGIENYAPGSSVLVFFENPVPEEKGTMKASLNYLSPAVEDYFEE